MINMINGWFYPASQPGQNQSSSVLSETIIMIALSALSLIGANSMDREAPGLAVLLRLVPVGLTLIWLFRRCLPNDGAFGQGYNHQPAPIILPQPVQQPYQPYWNWGNWFGRTHYQAPVYNNPQPVYHNPPPPVYVPPVQPFVPQQAHPQSKTNYSHAQPAAFPHVVPAPAQPGGFPQVPRGNGNPGAFPKVVPAHPQSGGFPPVQQTPAYVPPPQPHQQSRTNYSHAQPAVKAYQPQTYQAPAYQAPAYHPQPSAPPPTHYVPQGSQSGKVHFPAAVI